MCVGKMSVVDRGIHSNLMYLAALNVSCMYALHLPILFPLCASYTILSLIEFWKLHHVIIFSPGLHCKSEYTVYVLVEVIRRSLCAQIHMARTIHSATYNSKKLCNYYYSASNNDTEWRCRKCEQLKSKNGGWTNLLSHLKLCIGKDYALHFVEHADAARMQQQHAELVGAGDASAGTMNSFVLHLSDAEKEMAEGISYLVMKNQPISSSDSFVDLSSSC